MVCIIFVSTILLGIGRFTSTNLLKYKNVT